MEYDTSQASNENFTGHFYVRTAEMSSSPQDEALNDELVEDVVAYHGRWAFLITNLELTSDSSRTVHGPS